MPLYQIRIYTISNPHDADEYFRVNWLRHVESLEKFDIHTEHVFKEVDTKRRTRVIALCRYDDGVDVEAVNAAYMHSAELREDMAGFNKLSFRGVKTITVERDDYL